MTLSCVDGHIKGFTRPSTSIAHLLSAIYRNLLKFQHDVVAEQCTWIFSFTKSMHIHNYCFKFYIKIMFEFTNTFKLNTEICFSTLLHS